MKVIIVAVCLLVLVWAEPPPSKGYLPPSAGRSNGFGSSNGYGASGGSAGSSGLPGVFAARSQGFQGGNNFGRSNSFGHSPGASARFSSNSYGGAAGRSGSGYGGGFGRNAGDDGFGNEPASYNFDYMVQDDTGFGAEFGHHEERQEETAHGEYHVVLPDGRKQIVSYQADEGGFKPRISYEDTGLSRSGYDGNSQNFGRSSGDSFRNGGYASGRSGGY